jgi:dipeptide/tripeptide permease
MKDVVVTTVSSGYRIRDPPELFIRCGKSAITKLTPRSLKSFVFAVFIRGKT